MSYRDYEFVDLYRYKYATGIKFSNSKGEIVLRRGVKFYLMGKGDNDYITLDKDKGPYFKVTQAQVNKLDPRVDHLKDVWSTEKPDTKKKIVDQTIVIGDRSDRPTKGNALRSIPNKKSLKEMAGRIKEDRVRPMFGGNNKKSKAWFKENKLRMVVYLTAALKAHLDDGRTDESWNRVHPDPRADTAMVTTDIDVGQKRSLKVTFGFSRIDYQPFFGLSIWFDSRVYPDYKRLLKQPIAAGFIDLVGAAKQELKRKYGVLMNVIKPQAAHISMGDFRGTVVSWSANL